MRIDSEHRKSLREKSRLQSSQLHRQRFAFWRDIEQPLTSVIGGRPLGDVALVDQLLEDAAEGLLGDFENIKEFRDLHSRIAIDEMQYPVMSAAESKHLERIIRVADEVPIGKEQEYN